MADGGSCHRKVLILGHSFVRRLGYFFEGQEIDIRGHQVMFHGWGGATVKDLRDKLLGIDVTNFCIVYVEIGTNDLCSELGDIVASNIWALVAYLRTHGAAQVIFGQILFRTRRGVRGPLVAQFRVRLEEVNSRMRDWMELRGDVFYWKHWGLHNTTHICYTMMVCISTTSP